MKNQSLIKFHTRTSSFLLLSPSSTFLPLLPTRHRSFPLLSLACKNDAPNRVQIRAQKNLSEEEQEIVQQKKKNERRSIQAWTNNHHDDQRSDGEAERKEKEENPD
jgi:hypothetical protein